MLENGSRLTCKQAKEIDLVVYFARLGFAPAKIKGNNFWYHSPLRQEKTPSFKINRKLNRWYDFGSADGGSILDFGIRYYRCGIADLLRILSGAVLPPVFAPSHSETAEPQIVVTTIKPLCHPSLISYLLSRKIPFSLAGQYCHEVSYQIGHRNYFAIGFKNDLGGYELRNAFFKGSSSPKALTCIGSGSSIALVFEGFIDFLSYLVLAGLRQSDPIDIVILNGVGFFDKAVSILKNYQHVYLFLDNDAAGQNCSRKAIASDPMKFINLSQVYASENDLNDFLCSDGAFDHTSLAIVLKPP